MAAGVILPQSGATRLTYITKETASETLPGSPTWDVLRNTGGAGITPNIETIQSSELSGSNVLGIRDIIRVSTLGQSDYNYEFSKGAPFELLLESLLQNDFGLNADGSAGGNADLLTPGSKAVTFSIEDTFSDINQSIYLQGCRTSSMSFSMQSAQIVTGSFTAAGTNLGQNSPTVFTSESVTFVASPATMTFTTNIPANISAGDHVRIQGSTSNDGYYEIASVDSATQLTVIGTLVAGTQAVTAAFTGQTLFEVSTGSANAVNTSEAFKAGNSIQVEFKVGASYQDSLHFGLRLPQADVTITTESNNLSEITEDQPFAIIATNRSVELALTYYLVNLYPLEQILGDKEFGVRITLTNSDSEGYIFTFPRCKSQSATPGDASLGSEISGSWTLQALLDATDVLMTVERF